MVGSHSVNGLSLQASLSILTKRRVDEKSLYRDGGAPEIFARSALGSENENLCAKMSR